MKELNGIESGCMYKLTMSLMKRGMYYGESLNTK